MYEALRRKAQIRDRESMKRKVLSYLTHDNPLLFRLNVSRKLKDVLEKIDELVTETNKFGLVARAEAASIVHPQTHSGLDDLMEIVGRDDDKEVIVKLLLEQHDNKKVEVLPIIGMGGLGKTTLAKMVYNDRRIQQHFELPMWLCVSDVFNVSALVRSIIELAKKEDCHLPNSIELLRGRLQEVLGRKRYLLVLDDVWNEEEQRWEEELRPLLCSAGSSGSVIVVTSRSQRVASIMGTLPCCEPACLKEDDSWELFRKKAFSKGAEEQQELVIIGKCIVDKCKGLPLALKTMGGLMSSKSQVREWEAIAENEIWDNVQVAHGIMPILELSYRYLSSEMKQCFAFCAIFPKDYEMEKNTLIQLWMANGFLQEEGTMDFEQKGELIFNELVWRSFFQDVRVMRGDYINGLYYMRNVCKMHDLMHDLAKSITDECLDAQELSQQKASLKDVYHMRISAHPLEDINKLLKDVAHLRTLLMPRQFRNMNIKSSSLVPLRALEDGDLSIIKRQLINARYLRYLDLSYSNITSLPNSVCMLYNLQSLILSMCDKLRYLPRDMRYMRKLRHIYLHGCDKLECMPPSIGELNNLRTLTTFVVDTENGCGIEELKDMQHLGGWLELHNLKKIKNGSNAKIANLRLKQSIRQLVLVWSQHQSQDVVGNEIGNDEEVLESLMPHDRLNLLRIESYGGTKISSWMKNFDMFQQLNILHMYKCQRLKDLPALWSLPRLEELKLRHMDNLMAICNGVDVEAEGCNNSIQIFPELKTLCLEELQNFERWAENKSGEPITSIMFPKLQHLKISYCPKLASIPDSPVLTRLGIFGDCKIAISSLKHLTALSYLRYTNSGACDSISMQDIPFISWHSLVSLSLYSLSNIMMPPEEQRPRSPLKSLRSLCLYDCNIFFSSDLSKGPLVFWEYFQFVEELEIAECDGLVRWPREELSGLNRLQSLSIECCKNLIGPSSEDALLLPRLEEFRIQICDSLLEIPKLPASLRRLPDGMDGLVALQELRICWCRGMKALPDGLLQRLSSLKTLWIEGCPSLERQCRRGGEYWEFVSPIPDLHIISAQKGSTSGGFVKRLLPTCSQL